LAVDKVIATVNRLTFWPCILYMEVIHLYSIGTKLQKLRYVDVRYVTEPLPW